MKPTWIVESHVGDEPGFVAMLDCLRTGGYPHHVMRFIPFSYDTVGVEPEIVGCCIGFGGAGVAEYVKRKKLLPGIWTGPEFAPSVYARRLGEHFLNHKQVKCRLSEVLTYVAENGLSEVFMRPDDDLKSFAGRSFTKMEIENWIADLRTSGLLAENDYWVVVAPLQEIGREWRTVVVDREPVGWSQYKQDGRRKVAAAIEHSALATVRKAVSIFSPASVFVADVCETPSGMKIVEYNTFNSAGLYACDHKVVVDAVSAFVMKEGAATFHSPSA